MPGSTCVLLGLLSSASRVDLELTSFPFPSLRLYQDTLRTKFGPGPAVPPTPVTPSLLPTYPQIPSIVIAPSSAAMAYPSPPSSPIALSISASSDSSPASSLGEPCTTPPDAAAIGGYEASKKAFDERHPQGVVTKVVERACNDEDEEEMEGVRW